MRFFVVVSRLVFSLTIFIGLGFASTAQEMLEQERAYDFGGMDQGIYVQQLHDQSGYIITGQTDVNGSFDILLVKTDTQGQILPGWPQIFDIGGHDEGRSVRETSDGGFIITGKTAPGGSDPSDAFLIKTDINGRVGEDIPDTFIKKYDYNYMGYENQGFDVIEIENGYAVIGTTYIPGNSADVWFFKTDSNGDIPEPESSWTWGSSSHEFGLSIQRTSDEGYVIGGYTASLSGSEDFLLIKTDKDGLDKDENGNVVDDSPRNFLRNYGGSGTDTMARAQQTYDGGYVIVGSSTSFSNNWDVLLIKTDESGMSKPEDVQNRPYKFEKTYHYDLTNTGNDYGTRVRQTSNNGYIIVGQTDFVGNGVHDVYVITTEENGIKRHDYNFPNRGNKDDWGYGIDLTKCGGFIVVGATESFGGVSDDLYLVKMGLNDDEGPVTSDVRLNPNPVELTATIDDSTTGGSTIASAEYEIGDSENWIAMGASDGSFDEVVEDVEAIMPPFSVPGVYKIDVRGTDCPGNIGQEEPILLAVYDPDGGFVTGGGWIMSPAGALAEDLTLTGKANFGFVSKYKKGAAIPTGQTEFQFKVADLNFHSGSYDWLVVAGAKAKYKGVGTINGNGNYGFMLTATDEALTPSTDVDLFRIKIWDRDNGDAIVYDNKMGEADDSYAGTAIGGGNIKVHGGDSGAPAKASEFSLLQNYPNSFNPETWIPYKLAEAVDVSIKIYDVSGKLVRNLNLGHKSAGIYTSKDKAAYWDGKNEAGEQSASGIYFYTIQAGEFTATKKMLLEK